MLYFRRLTLILFLFAGFSVFGRTAVAGPWHCANKIPLFLQTDPPGKDTVVIRFEYKQSALFHKFTMETLDSVVRILLSDTSIKLAIDGYAYQDEGSDTVCYYLSLNRALFIQTYVLGRGVTLDRVNQIKAWGRTRQQYVNKDKNGLLVNCRAELRLVYPPPPKKKDLSDRDSDGLADDEDRCPDVFGYKDNGGCPDSGAVIVPFDLQESSLIAVSYTVLDSMVKVLKKDPSMTVSIDGHAHFSEGSFALCKKLAEERAEIVKNYLLSRMISPSRILEVKGSGISKPLNAAKTPRQLLSNARAEIWVNGIPKPISGN